MPHPSIEVAQAAIQYTKELMIYGAANRPWLPGGARMEDVVRYRDEQVAITPGIDQMEFDVRQNLPAVLHLAHNSKIDRAWG